MEAIEIIGLLFKISLFITCFNFGMRGTFDKAVFLFSHPYDLLRSAISMYLLMPLVALIFVLYTDLEPLIKVTLAAISVSPLAPLFPGKTLRAGGRDNYIMGLMISSGILSLAFIYPILWIMTHLVGKELHLLFLPIIKTILISVIIPLIAGIGMKKVFPSTPQKISKALNFISGSMLILGSIKIFFVFYKEVLELAGNKTILFIAVFVIVGNIIGYILGGQNSRDRNVLALATASRHPAIAMIITTSNLGEHKSVPAAIILYLLINFVFTGIYTMLIARVKQGSLENIKE